jgi:hypothetical protein
MTTGQTITVMAPDGSRTVKASIPNGLRPGDSFLVRLAKPIRRDVGQGQADNDIHPPAQPKFGSALESWLSPLNDSQTTNINTTNCANQREEVEQVESQTSKPLKIETLDSSNPSVETSTTPNPAESTDKKIHRQMSQQRLILVQVPAGMSGGQTMHVEVPGEGRTLSVQIPPNVETFHVSYTPRVQQTSADATAGQREAPFCQREAPYGQNEVLLRQQSPTGQKLLLVRVPPGTPAGTTLHVSVPDEPGRILAAQVPPGNVSEFHVSYEARPPGLRRGMLPPANPYANSAYPNSEQSRNSNIQINNTIAASVGGDVGPTQNQNSSNKNTIVSEQGEDSDRRDEGNVTDADGAN